MSKLLINEQPLMVLPSLAQAIGLNEAIVLQQIHYWIAGNQERKSEQHFRDGKWWTYNTAEEWAKQFPWWSVSTVKRTLLSLRRQGLIEVDSLCSDQCDRTNWYTVDYARLEALGQPDTAHRVKLTRWKESDCTDGSVQVDTIYNKESETNTDTTSEISPPAREAVNELPVGWKPYPTIEELATPGQVRDSAAYRPSKKQFAYHNDWRAEHAPLFETVIDICHGRALVDEAEDDQAISRGQEVVIGLVKMGYDTVGQIEQLGRDWYAVSYVGSVKNDHPTTAQFLRFAGEQKDKSRHAQETTNGHGTHQRNRDNRRRHQPANGASGRTRPSIEDAAQYAHYNAHLVH